jgi:hypothetical protein
MVAVAGLLGLAAAVVLDRDTGGLDSLVHQLGLFIREIHLLDQRINLRELDALRRAAARNQGGNALLDAWIELHCDRVHFLSHGCPLHRVPNDAARRATEPISLSR